MDTTTRRPYSTGDNSSGWSRTPRLRTVLPTSTRCQSSSCRFRCKSPSTSTLLGLARPADGAAHLRRYWTRPWARAPRRQPASLATLREEGRLPIRAPIPPLRSRCPRISVVGYSGHTVGRPVVALTIAHPRPAHPLPQRRRTGPMGSTSSWMPTDLPFHPKSRLE